MKRFVLMRHAAYANASADRDYDKILSGSGKKEAKNAATDLKQLSFTPDIILTSLAKRAKETADIIADDLSVSSDMVFGSKALYLAPYETFWAALKEVPKSYDSVLLIGHNPGISLLVRYFLGDAHPVSLSTADFAVFDFSGNLWSDIDISSVSFKFVNTSFMS